MSQARLKIVHHPPHIVDKTAIAHAALHNLPSVKIGKLVVLLHLPELIAEARPVAVVAVEDDRLAGFAYVLVIMRRR